MGGVRTQYHMVLRSQLRYCVDMADGEALERRRRIFAVREYMDLEQNLPPLEGFFEVYEKATGHSLPRDARIHEFGAGKGRLSKYLKEQGFTNVTASDAEKQNDAVFNVAIGSVEDVSSEAQYDVLIGLNVFDAYHYPKQGGIQNRMVAGILRALKPGGFLLSNGDIEKLTGISFNGYELGYDVEVGIKDSKVIGGVVLRKQEAL